ncbi:MAG: hypothetical protein DMD64_05675 [Gemmatimonadetes bacterium]|nr:MAG: hypothetical protein DMD64_05675 [Gemmatimonadota bacterium]
MTPSQVALVLANAVPLVGVLLLGWTVFPLLLLYWLENVVVGGFNVLKMLLAKPAEPVYWAGKLFLIPFFIVHFGGFTFVHGVLVVAFFGPKGIQPFDLLTAVPAAIRANQLGWGVLSLIASHGFSFYWNYVKNGEYQRASLQALMGQPYGRVMVLHLTVLFGGWIVMLLGSPVGALLVLVALKTAADWRGHRAERRKFAALPEA